MGCGSSKDVKEIDLSNQVNDIPADLEVEKENLLKNEECHSSDGVRGETNAYRELLGRSSQSEMDRDKEGSDSKSLSPESKLAKERHDQWLFHKGTQVKLLKNIPHSILKDSLGVVQHLAFNVVGVKFNSGTAIKFSTDNINEQLKIYCDSDVKSFVENVDCEMVQPVLYGSAPIQAAVNTILDDKKSPK